MLEASGLSPIEITNQTETLRWVLSTTAQGAAAFVAIVAGFVLTRVLNVASLRKDFETRASLVAVELENLDSKIQILAIRINERHLKAFAKDYLDSIIKAHGDMEKLNRLWEAEPSSRPMDEELVDRFCQQTAEAYRLLEEKFPGPDGIPQDFKDLVEQEELIQLEKFDVLHKVVSRLNVERTDSRNRAAQKEAEARSEPWSRVISQIMGSSNVQSSLIGQRSAIVPTFPVIPDPSAALDRTKYKELMEQRSEKEQEYKHLSTEANRLKSTRGFRSAFWLIGSFGLFGVVLPQAAALFDYPVPVQIGFADVAMFTVLFCVFLVYLYLQLRGVKGTNTGAESPK